MILFAMGTSDSGICIYQYILGTYNIGMLYLKAFIFVLKAFVIQSSTISKIKAKVFVAFWTDKCALVGNIINLEGFKCYHPHIKVCFYLGDCIITSLLKKVKVYWVEPLSKQGLEQCLQHFRIIKEALRLRMG